MIGKIKTFFDIVSTYENYGLAILDALKLKDGEGIVKLRNKLKFKVRLGEKDTNIINEVFISKSYQSVYPIIKESRNIIDIGAHIGTFSVLASKISPKSKIYSYEPFNSSFKVLSDNLKINNSENVQGFMYAVVGDNRKKDILRIGAISNEFAGNSLYGDGINVTVDCTNLEEIFEKNKIKNVDLLKIDCEGAEYEIILNCSKKILNKINNIILEYHEGVKYKGEYKTPQDIIVKLKSAGFLIERPTKGIILAKKK